MTRLGVNIPNPPTQVTPRRGGAVPLTAEEQRAHSRSAGALIEQYLTDELRDARYQALDDTQKVRRLEALIRAARDQAGAEMLQGLSDAEIERQRGMLSAVR